MTRRRTARKVRMTLLTVHCHERARRIRKPCLGDWKTVSSTMGASTRTQRARNLYMSSHRPILPLAMTLVAIGGDFVPHHQSRLGRTDNIVHALQTTKELRKALQNDLRIFQCTHSMRGPPDWIVKLPAYSAPLKVRGSNILLPRLYFSKHRNAAL
jgi:hypothetical protein